jgi:hypothetical protein
MDQKALFNLYIDYLISNSGEVTATGLSAVSNGLVSHDQVTRLLNSHQGEFTAASYWQRIKPIIREVNGAEGVMIIDDFVEEKPYSKENELIAYHYSHLQHGSVKGINIVHLLYSVMQASERVNIPVAFELVRKTETRTDPQTGKKQRFSLVNKNQMARNLLHQVTYLNHIPYGYVLADSWYASTENMVYVKQRLKKDFVFGLKANRKVALSKGALRRKEFVQVTDLRLEPGQLHQIWLKDVPFPLLLAKEVYVNQDRSTATLFLVTSQLDLSYQQIISLYPIRWKIEESHKSLKNNASLAKSPTKVVRTQANHVFASFCALVKLEIMKIRNKVSHFTIKKAIQVQAARAAMKELNRIKYSFPTA